METQWRGLHALLRDKQQFEIIAQLAIPSIVSPDRHQMCQSLTRTFRPSSHPFLSLSPKCFCSFYARSYRKATVNDTSPIPMLRASLPYWVYISQAAVLVVTDFTAVGPMQYPPYGFALLNIPGEIALVGNHFMRTPPFSQELSLNKSFLYPQKLFF